MIRIKASAALTSRGLAAGVGERPAFPPGSTSTCFVRVGGMGRGSGAGPVGYGPSGSSAPGKLRKRSASGHAAANARRMRLAVSMTRAAIFKRRRRSVANSTVANSRAWEWRRARPASTNKRRCGERGGLGSAERQLVRSEASCVLCSLIRFSALAARAIQVVVDPLGRADIEAGNDEADVEAEHRRLNTGDGAPFVIPGLCLVARLGIRSPSAVRAAARRSVRSATSSPRRWSMRRCGCQEGCPLVP